MQCCPLFLLVVVGNVAFGSNSLEARAEEEEHGGPFACRAAGDEDEGGKGNMDGSIPGNDNKDGADEDGVGVACLVSRCGIQWEEALYIFCSCRLSPLSDAMVEADRELYDLVEPVRLAEGLPVLEHFSQVP